MKLELVNGFYIRCDLNVYSTHENPQKELSWVVLMKLFFLTLQ